MLLHLLRFSTTPESTLGALLVDGQFFCFTMEDTFQYVKAPGHTRIPNGQYQITLRTEGGLHAKYSHLYPDVHRGMLWLRNVPGFKWIYIHAGNGPLDTKGCILVGDTASNNAVRNAFVGTSVAAYLRLYDRVLGSLDRGEQVWIRISSFA